MARLVWINPHGREVGTIEGDPDVVCRERIAPPPGLVDIDGTTGLVVCTIGGIGAAASLWWHHELGEVFGGCAMVVGVDADGNMTGVDEGSWLRTRRSVEFLGTADLALPRLRQLVEKAMGELLADGRQGVLELEPRR